MTKKFKNLEDELHRLRKSHSEVTAEAIRFQDLHRKGLMDYTQRKADFVMVLEELRKRASDRSWAQASKISSLEVELAAAWEKIDQLEGSSSWLTVQADRDRDWSKKFSNLQKQLQDAKANYNAYRIGWSGQVEDYRRKLQTTTDEVARLRRQLSERVQSTSAQGSDELCSLRETMEELFVALGREQAELRRLKIQLVHEQQANKDAETESEILRKRLRESEGKSRWFHQMYWEMLLRKKELEEEVKNLKQSLTMTGTESSKSEEVELP